MVGTSKNKFIMAQNELGLTVDRYSNDRQKSGLQVQRWSGQAGFKRVQEYRAEARSKQTLLEDFKATAAELSNSRAIPGFNYRPS